MYPIAVNDELRNSKVLVVDDIPKNIEIIYNILNQEGLEIISANSGMEAIDKAAIQHPDLILLDIMMPDMDGFETVEQLKMNSETENIPVIFLTALRDNAHVIQAFQLGAVDYLPRPFNFEELVARVFTHLEIKKSRDKIEIQNQQLKDIQAKIVQDAQKIIILNEKIMDSEEKLKEVSETKDKFFSIIAQDLRNPLGGLNMQIDLLHQYFDKMSREEIKAAVESMYKTSKKNFEMFENLLIWSKIQIGTLDYFPEPRDVHPIITEAMAFLKPLADMKNIEIISDVNESTFACFDNFMMGVIFRNLISNAIKYTNTGGKVRITSGEISSDINQKQYLEIKISDTGIGLDTDLIPRLFKIESLRQPSVGTGEEKGIGLGLIICKEFINKHGGSLIVETIPNTGSTFCFTVPKYM
ncbi:MAG: response regulator receiver sensor signal transduction histidine kinase [Ignavibacteria bacterium]|nr:response regulator receiver sensor signal transduction histidine kinase [Ignavibacteria bacterium]